MLGEGGGLWWILSAGHSSGDRKCIVSLVMGPSVTHMADRAKEWLATSM